MTDSIPPTDNVRLRFTSREPDFTLADPSSVLIPTNFRRYHLSQYINSQLSLSTPIPFEFLINGTYLRTSIDEFLSSSGISSETTLNVEYIRARIPPQYSASFPHDDWVSSVDVDANSTRLVTASYDGRLRIWNTSSQILATSGSASEGGHLASIKSARFVNPSTIVSGSSDRTIKLWNYSDSEILQPKLELYGHKSTVESIATHPQSNRILSASADHMVGVWSTRKSDAPAAPSALLPRTVTREGKRRKLNPAVSAAQRGALRLMSGHTAAVHDVKFDVNDETVAYSASFDRNLKTWDLETGQNVDSRVTSSPLFCCQQMPTLNLVGAGSAERDIKMVDVRASANSVVAVTLRGHGNSVVCLAREPGSEYGLASGSHDGTVRIWDLRSTKSGKGGVEGQSVFTLPRESLAGKSAPVAGEGVKVFGLCWDAKLGILSAGEDKMVQINSSQTS